MTDATATPSEQIQPNAVQVAGRFHDQRDPMAAVVTHHVHLLADQGLSGDMFVGALIDAGADAEVVGRSVAMLGLEDVRVAWDDVTVNGVAATDFQVAIGPQAPRLETLGSIVDTLEGSDLPDSVRARARLAFERLAMVEAKVHDKPVDRVHLHELGNADTIVDVVATIVALDSLTIDTASVGPIALGSGTVTTDHGRVPVPAPAVAELMQGFDVTAGDGPGERTTPTGALLAAQFAVSGSLPALRLLAQGRGASDGIAGRRSILTVLVGQSPSASGRDAVRAHGDEMREESVVLLAATIDDMSPELLPASLQRLRDHPAVRDAWTSPQAMKKGRMGVTIHVLVGDPSATREVAQLVVTNTTTLGVRAMPHTRFVVARSFESVHVDGFRVRLKVARLDGRILRALPEHDDVADVAARTGRPLADVYFAAQRQAGHLK